MKVFITGLLSAVILAFCSACSGSTQPRVHTLPPTPPVYTFKVYTSNYIAKCGRVLNRKGNVINFKKCTVTVKYIMKRRGTTPTPVPIPVPTATSVQISDAQYLLTLINNKRATIGVAPLALNTQLSTCALAHSKRMWSEGQISHDGFPSPDICIPFSTAGQNVGQDNDPSHQGVLNDFNLMMSEGNTPLGSCLSGHDCNITYRGYTKIGIGIFDDGSRVWITENFVG